MPLPERLNAVEPFVRELFEADALEPASVCSLLAATRSCNLAAKRSGHNMHLSGTL